MHKASKAAEDRAEGTERGVRPAAVPPQLVTCPRPPPPRSSLPTRSLPSNKPGHLIAPVSLFAGAEQTVLVNSPHASSRQITRGQGGWGPFGGLHKMRLGVCHPLGLPPPANEVALSRWQLRNWPKQKPLAVDAAGPLESDLGAAGGDAGLLLEDSPLGQSSSVALSSKSSTSHPPPPQPPRSRNRAPSVSRPHNVLYTAGHPFFIVCLLFFFFFFAAVTINNASAILGGTHEFASGIILANSRKISW